MGELYDWAQEHDKPGEDEPARVSRWGDAVFYVIVCYGLVSAALLTDQWVNGQGC